MTPETVNVEGDVIFDSGQTTTGLTHAPGTSAIQFNLAGTYLVDFSVSATEANQMAVFVDGGEVAGSTYGSGSGTQQNNGQVILSVNAGDFVTLRNHSSPTAVHLAVTGGTRNNVNASIVIEKLG